MAQAGKNLIEERFKIMNDLWAQGFKVETLYQENPKMQRQLEFALEGGIPLVLIIGETEVEQGIVKVKSLNKKEEYTLTREELAQGDRLRQIIADGNAVLLPQILQESQQEKKPEQSVRGAAARGKKEEKKAE